MSDQSAPALPDMRPARKAGFRVSGPWPSVFEAGESGPLTPYSALSRRSCQHGFTALQTVVQHRVGGALRIA